MTTFSMEAFVEFVTFQAKYIAECLDEIKCELKLDNLAAKANAINKLIYVSLSTGYYMQIDICAVMIIRLRSAANARQ